MRNTTKLKIVGMTLFLITLSSGCASLLASSLPSLENRTLRISAEFAGFEYQWQVCAKRVLGVCTKREMKKDKYDLTDVETRRKLIDMGFVAKVREKVTP